MSEMSMELQEIVKGDSTQELGSGEVHIGTRAGILGIQ